MTKNKSKPDIKKILLILLPYLLAALISAVIGIITFKVRGIAPFGDNSVLCMDLWGQYFSMYVNNKEAEGLSGLFYSWNGAFGFNNWAQSAYYCNSIFIYLMKFIPNARLVTAIDIFCLIKIMLSAVTCLGFLHYKLERRSPVLIAGAVSYSLCAYMLAFMSQFMWTDSMFLAPLMLIGIEQLIHKKKAALYTITLAIAIISSFYIGFAMCIFSVLYFLANSVLLLELPANGARLRLKGANAFGGAVLRFGIFSLLAGAISAAVIIPVGIAISKTIASEAAAPERLEWYGNFTNVLRDLLSGQNLYLEYKGVNIACGIIVFLAIPLYFFNQSIRAAERIVSAVTLLFLIASANCNYLNYMWHGFHFPNQLPGRWSFLFSLYLILLTCKGLIHFEKLSPQRAIGGTALGVSLIYITSLGLGETPTYEMPRSVWNTVAILALLIMVGSFAANSLKNPEQTAQSDKEEDAAPDAAAKPEAKAAAFAKKYLLTKSAALTGFSLLTALMMIVDIGSHFVTVSQYEGANGLQVSNEENYTSQLMRASDNGHQWKSGSDDFYRVEANNGFTFNCSMIGNYHGMRYYSSTMNGDVFRLLKFLGNRVYADKVSSVYTLSSPVQNSLFGIRYFMDFDRYLANILPGTVVVEDNDAGLFRENTTALPLAYAVSDDIFNFSVTDEIRAIRTQNDLVNKMCGTEIDPFKLLPCDSFKTENVTLSESDDWNSNYFTGNGQPSVFRYSYTVADGGLLFMEHNFRAGTIHITAPNVDRSISPGDGAFAYLGSFEPNTTVQIDVTIEGIGLGCFGLNLYRMNEQDWDSAYRQLAAHGMEVTSFKNTRVDGKINMESGGLVFASIPDDGGWSVYCDGKRVTTNTVCGALLAVRIPQGEHTLSFRYSVPGFKAGMLISILGVLLFLIACNFEWCMQLCRRLIPARPAAEETDGDTEETDGDAEETDGDTEDTAAEPSQDEEPDEAAADADTAPESEAETDAS